PVVLFFTGGGAPCEVYVRLLREMGRSWRVLVVEREGYGRSIRGDDTGEEGTSSSRGKQIMARDSAEELSALLRVMGVKGPYVLVAHSYGAIVAREFLDVQGVHLDKVVGLALIEPASELLYQTHKPVIPPPAFDAVLKGVDVDKVTRLREESGMTDAEWDDAIRGIEKTAPGAALEECRASGRILADKHQLTRHVMSPWPVAVLRCNWAVELQKLFDAGVEAGNGSDEERKQVREFLWAWRAFDDEVRAGLDMAEGGVTRRYTYFEECGHDVPSRRPDVVIQEVGWVM
ncbi:alpha/beta-hydrolase, partial [Polyplosphaeria fusca]